MVAAQVASSLVHFARGVTVTVSVTRRRDSRDPIHAAAPASGATKSITEFSWTLAARMFHSGGMAMARRYPVSQNSATATGSTSAIAL